MRRRQAAVLQYYGTESVVSLCGISVGDSRHTAVRGGEEIKRQCQEQPPLIKMLRLTLPDLTAHSYCLTLAWQCTHAAQFNSSTHTLSLLRMHAFVWVLFFVCILMHSQCLISVETRVHT